VAKLSGTFGPHDTLLTYFWMYGPQRERPRPMCTSFLGSLDIPARDIVQRVSFAVLGRSPVARQLAFCARTWLAQARVYQCIGDEFPHDYRAISEDDGIKGAMLAVWHRNQGNVHLFWTPEATRALKIPASIRISLRRSRRCGTCWISHRVVAAPTGILAWIIDD
jgi:predicted dithiol-disulfide oxidoreductase (DUF899 family)